jgi:hypothetical protein
MPDLGQLTRIDATQVWEDEPNGFTPWLVENIDLLGQALGLELEVTEREAQVGDFFVDLVARDIRRNKLVVIENQLKQTDPDHLGRLIIYAAGLDAGVVVWISCRFREEHRQALDWLNKVHEGRTAFFGVVLEVLKIGDSKPAVNLRPVAFPNEWSRKPEVSPKGAAYQRFFQKLVDELREKHKFTNSRVAAPWNWDDFSTGVGGFRWGMSFALGERVRTELYITTGDGERNTQILDKLYEDRSDIEREFGESLEWERLEEKQACRIACYRKGKIDEPDEVLDEIRKWGIGRLLKFKSVLGPRLKQFAS